MVVARGGEAKTGPPLAVCGAEGGGGGAVRNQKRDVEIRGTTFAWAYESIGCGAIARFVLSDVSRHTVSPVKLAAMPNNPRALTRSMRSTTSAANLASYARRASSGLSGPTRPPRHSNPRNSFDRGWRELSPVGATNLTCCFVLIVPGTIVIYICRRPAEHVCVFCRLGGTLPDIPHTKAQRMSDPLTHFILRPARKNARHVYSAA